MTISYVGAGTFAAVSTGNLTLTEPAGCQEGDFLVAFVLAKSPGANTIGTPSGWTFVRFDTVNDGNNRATLHVAYIQRGASTPADRVFVPTANLTLWGTIVAIRSSRGKLFLDTSNGVSAGLGTAVSSSGFTTARANEFLLMACGLDDDGSTASGQGAATDPTSGSWTEQVESGTATGSDAGLAIATATKATAGATGNFSYTASVTGRHALSTLAFYEEYYLTAANGTFSHNGQAVSTPAGLLHQYIGSQTFTPPAGGTTVSLNNVPAGAADAERRLLIGVIHINSGTSPGSNVVTNMTVEGVAATRLNEAGTGTNVSWWMTDKIPSGTDVDIVITNNASVVLSANIFGKIHVYRLIGAAGVPLDTLADTGSSGADDPTGTIDESRFGVNFILTTGGLYATTAATHAQPAGYTEDAEAAELRAGDSFRCTNSVASKWNGVAATNVTTSVDVTNGTGSSSSNISMAAVAIRYGLNDAVLPVDSGSFAHNGQTANLLVAHRLISAFGSFAHTGQTASLLAARILSAGHGVYSYLGQDATLQKAVTIVAETGLFEYAGMSATLSKLRRNPWDEEDPAADTWTETISLSSGWVEESPLPGSWSEQT